MGPVPVLVKFVRGAGLTALLFAGCCGGCVARDLLLSKRGQATAWGFFNETAKDGQVHSQYFCAGRTPSEKKLQLLKGCEVGEYWFRDLSMLIGEAPTFNEHFRCTDGRRIGFIVSEDGCPFGANFGVSQISVQSASPPDAGVSP